MWARIGFQTDKSSLDKAENAIKGLKSSLAGLAAGYGFFQAFRAVRDAIQETADAARRLSLESKRTGLDPQFLQELEYGAKRTGVSTEALQHGLAHLARSAYEASNGSGEAGATFQKLGVQVKGADGKVRPIRELLGDVADKFSGIQNAAEANAVSMQLMGRAGAELIPFFQLGSEGIAKMGAAARKTGGIMSDYLVRQGERTADAIDDVQMSVRGLTYAILGPLLPAITKGKNELAKWIQEHRKLIALRAHDVFNLLTRAMKGVVAVAQEIPKTLALVGVGLLAWASPITAIAGAFALLAEDLYTYFGEHNPYSITFLVIGFFKLLKKRFDDIWKDFKENPFGFLVQKAKEAFDGIVAEAKKLPQRLKDATAPDAGGLGGAIRSTLETLAPTDEQSWRNPFGSWNVARRAIHQMDAVHDYFTPQRPVPYLSGPSSQASSAPSLTAYITINAPAGADASRIGDATETAVDRVFSRLWERKMQENSP